MKKYKIYGKCVAHYYTIVEADSEEEAYDMVMEVDEVDWERDIEYDQMNDTWETYDCEEV